MKLAVAVLLLSTFVCAQPKQRFVCNTGYTASQCHKEMVLLHHLLEDYHGNWLGDWTWVLVRTEDWHSVLVSVNIDSSTPAFSDLTRRQTFFDEALFEPSTPRRAELLKTWQMPIEQLRVLAIAHEIGHAMCNDRSESRADKRAQVLQEGKLPSCGAEVMRAAK